MWVVGTKLESVSWRMGQRVQHTARQYGHFRRLALCFNMLCAKRPKLTFLFSH
jgi:hypothetical protein